MTVRSSVAWMKRMRRSLVRRIAGQPQVLPNSAYGPNGVGLGVDGLVRLSGREAILRGWLIDQGETIQRVELVAGRSRTAFPMPLLRTRRPGLDEACGDLGVSEAGNHGFVTLVSGSGDWPRAANAIVEVILTDGSRIRVGCPQHAHGPRAAVSLLERTLDGTHPVDRLQVDTLVVPVIDRLYDQSARSLPDTTCVRIGDPPNQPALSAILLYPFDQPGVLECRIAALARRPARTAFETVVVTPTRVMGPAFEAMLLDLADLYRCPLRLVVVGGDEDLVSFPHAAARHCRGRWLCVLGGGVVPEVAALDTLVAFASQHSAPGMVGPRLVFEDLSIHHAGIGFVRDRVFGGPPHLSRYLRGLPNGLPQAGRTQAVAAVSGDCFLIERHTFDSVAQPWRRYPTPGFDEVEIGLRCIEAGLSNWYLADAELYNLEELGRLPSQMRSNDWFERADEQRLARHWPAQQEAFLEESGSLSHAGAVFDVE